MMKRLGDCYLDIMVPEMLLSNMVKKHLDIIRCLIIIIDCGEIMHNDKENH